MNSLHSRFRSALRLVFVALGLGGTLLCSPTLSAGWYKDVFPKPNADIVMLDVYYPHFNEPTYFACWNVNFHPTGGYFYGGVAAYFDPKRHDKKTYSPGSVWTFWEHESYETRQARNIYAAPEVYSIQYGGEGSSGAAGSPLLPWIKLEQWYTMLIRVWGSDEKKKEAFVGQWQKDITHNEWHHIGTFRIPTAITGVAGNSEFIEGTGGGMKPREVWRGKGYLRYGKEWAKMNQIEIDVPKDNGSNYYGWMVTQPEDKAYVTLAYTGDRQYPANLETDKKYTLEINQPDTPSLDPIIATGTASSCENELIISWDLDKHSSPQLGFRVEVFDNADCKGKPLYVREELTPHQRVTSIVVPQKAQAETKTGASATLYPKFTLIDIFDQESVIDLGEVKQEKAPPSLAEKTQAGLAYSYVEKDGGWDSLKDVDFSTPTRTGNAHGLDLTLRGKREGGFAFSFEGFLIVPETGAYTFALRSCDGAKVMLGGEVLFDNDGLHGSSEIGKAVFLSKGMVPIKVSYFKKHAAPLHSTVWLGWAYGNKALETIPAENLVSDRAIKTPEAHIKAKPEGVSYTLGVQTNAENVKSIDYFNGAKHIGTATEKPFTLKAPVFEGDNTFRARVLYADTKTVDSDSTTVKGKNNIPSEWTYTCLGEKTLPHGIQHKDGVFSFVGNGEYLIHQPVEGDFELSLKVDDIKTGKDGILGRAWIGLMAKPHLSVDNFEFGIYQTANSGIRPCANYSDLATTRVASYELPAKNQYLKLTRHGKLLRAYSSPDGKKWTLAYERYQPQFPDKLYAGLTMHAVPGEGDAIFAAQARNLTLKKAEPYSPQPINPCVRLGKVLNYALFQNGYAARIERNGVTLLTPQDEATYKEDKLSLPEGASSVYALDYDGKTLLALAPVQEGKAAVFRSTDMGKTWEKTLDNLNADVVLENHVGAPLLAFNPRVADACVVASPKSGVFYSNDEGKTWSEPLLKDEPLTGIRYEPLFNDLVFGLSFDPETKATTIHEIRDGKHVDKRIAIPDLHILDFLFCKRDPGGVNIMTRNGYYHSYNGAAFFFRTLHNIESNAMYVAGDTLDQHGTTNYWMATADGSRLFKSFYFGLNWEEVPNLPKWGNVLKLRINTGNREDVTAFTETGLYRTTDAGASWKKIL